MAGALCAAARDSSSVGSRVVPSATAPFPAPATSISAFGCCVSPPSLEALATGALVSVLLVCCFSDAPRSGASREIFSPVGLVSGRQTGNTRLAGASRRGFLGRSGAWCAAARGTTTVRTRVVPTATTPIPATATTISAFGCCVSPTSSSPLRPLPSTSGRARRPRAFRKCRATTVARPRRRNCGWLGRVPSARPSGRRAHTEEGRLPGLDPEAPRPYFAVCFSQPPSSRPISATRPLTCSYWPVFSQRHWWASRR